MKKPEFPENDPKFAVLVEGLHKIALMLGVQLSEGRISVYWESLQRYPEKKLSRALREVLENETDKRFPTIGDIRKYMEPLTDPTYRQKKVPVYE